MNTHATDPFSLTDVFVRLRSDGGMDLEPLTPSFWSGDHATPGDRVVTVFEFASSDDLHSDLLEVHPDGDELIVVLAGAIDLISEANGDEVVVGLDAGQAAVVRRGNWHRLSMRSPGRLLSINVRSGMQSRRRDETLAVS
jgi:mannose-6-phosphate isomerase-like protein (cupin superfamily)